MSASPNGVSQAASKSAVRKKKREQKSLLIAPVNEGVNDPEFTRRADELRQECRAERVKVKADTRFGQRQSPINALPLKQAKTDAKEWQVLSLAVDSGAAESVIPHLLITEHPIRETEAYIRGLNNISATGDLLPNLGEQRPPLITRDGNTMSMTLQAAQVDRPLGSVKRKCHVGHRVVFDSDGSYVLNTATKEINWLREENGNYMLDMWVVPVSWLQQGTSDMTKSLQICTVSYSV